MKALVIAIALLIITTVVIFSIQHDFHANAENDKYHTQWPGFSEWFEWKIATELTEKQKRIINYLQKSSNIFNKASATKSVHPESEYGHPNPSEAVKIVMQLKIELENLPYPMECEEFRELSLENIDYIIKYHQLRLAYGDGDKEFQKKHRELELSFIDSEVDSKRFAEYFDCMRKVGLFDNIEKEAKALGLD